MFTCKKYKHGLSNSELYPSPNPLLIFLRESRPIRPSLGPTSPAAKKGWDQKKKKNTDCVCVSERADRLERQFENTGELSFYLLMEKKKKVLLENCYRIYFNKIGSMFLIIWFDNNA